jgi:DNA-binding FadR family transcriptional regulator
LVSLSELRRGFEPAAAALAARRADPHQCRLLLVLVQFPPVVVNSKVAPKRCDKTAHTGAYP